MSRFVFSLILAVLAISVFANADSYDEALCGPKPAPSALAAEDIKLHRIEKKMPPVQDQTPSGWCYAFSACDLLNYNIRREHVAKGEKFEYSNSNMVSPIDAVFQKNRFEDQNTTPPPDHPGRLNLTKGGDPFNVLLAIQQQDKVRSRAQIQFNALDEDNKDARILVNQIVTEYEKKNKPSGIEKWVPTGQYCPSELKEPIMTQLNSFESINKWLYDQAIVNKSTPNGTLIDDYEKLACEKGEPDLKVPAFSAQTIRTEDPLKFIAQAKETLYKIGQPMSINICANDIIPSSDTSCGGHQMTLVGAAYLNGKCTVRLKNSWGKSASNDGYVNVDIKSFLDAMNRDGGYHGTWIGSPKDLNQKIDDDYTFQGTIKSSKENFILSDGTKKYPDGSQGIYKNGVRDSLINYPMHDDPNSKYTGTVTPDGDLLDGNVMVDGVVTEVFVNGKGHRQ